MKEKYVSEETKAQKDMREHYEKLFKDAMDVGPEDVETLTDSHKGFLAWKYCQFHHVESAMGGFANFRYFITETAENEFKLVEKLKEENAELKKKLDARITLSFENDEDAKVALNAYKYKDTIEDIWQNVFRPSRKHGYSNPRITEILEGLQCGDENVGYDLIEELIEIHLEVVNDDDL